MRCGWKELTFGDVCSSISETYRGNDSEVILVNTSDVLKGKIQNHQSTENKNLRGQFKKTFQQNDILFSEIRPANKRYAYVDFADTEKYIASTKLMILRANTELILPRYLYYLLTSNKVLAELQHLAETRSGTFPQITFLSEIAPMKILIPPLETQKKISAILSPLDDKIELNRRINDNLEEQARAIFKHWFIDSDYRIGTASEIIEYHDSKRIPISSRERSKLAKIYPYYGATSVMDYVDRYIFDGVYLLLGEDGTVTDSKGFPILQYVNGKFWVNNHAHVITGRNGFSVELLYLLFSLTNVQSIVTGAVQPKISQASLNSVTVVIPPESELQKLDSIIQPLFSMIRNLRKENQTLAKIRDSLIPKLISGELDLKNFPSC